MKRVLFLFALITTTIVFIQSCKHSPLDILTDIPDIPIIDTNTIDTNLIVSDCDEDTVYFENDILPIFITNCAISGCHDAETHEEGINLSTYNKIISSGLLDLSDPWDSELIEVITENDPDDRMPPPPAASLTNEEINMLIAWQQQGALNNGCTDCDTAATTFSGAILPIMNTYCTGCHDATSPSAGIDLTSYLGSGSNAGVADVAADGRLVGAVSFEAGFVAMPLGGSMIQDCYIDQIRAWVDAGYPDN